MRVFIIALISFTITQTLAQPRNEVRINQIGNSTSVTVTQTNSAGKNTNIVNEGDYNMFVVLQQGAGTHTSTINSTVNNTGNNNNNIIEINQRGSGAHTANIIFDNNSGSNYNDVKINQSGNSNKNLSLTLQGNGIGFQSIQNNFSIPDSVSITIQCLSPPCTGYSYIKN